MKIKEKISFFIKEKNLGIKRKIYKIRSNLKKDKNMKSIYLLGMAKINEERIKLIFIKDFKLENYNYKGFFIEEKVTCNYLFFDDFKIKDLNKWYKIEEDSYGDILYLYYRKRKINL